jgi:AcrR family transcriptional regulator
MIEERPMRADARRNRARVLDAARVAFAVDGIGVPLDEIARRAGVGAGTVHRHFPTKEALFAAVVADHLEEQVQAARAALAAGDAAAGDRTAGNPVADAATEAFFSFIAQMITAAGTKKDLADALTLAGVDLVETLAATTAELRDALATLLERAQRAGTVRGDIDVADLHAIVLAALDAERRRADPARPGRLAGVVCDCLRSMR